MYLSIYNKNNTCHVFFDDDMYKKRKGENDKQNSPHNLCRILMNCLNSFNA